MTKSTYTRSAYRTTCGKCGRPARWGEVCVTCGANYTATERRQSMYPTERLRVGHGNLCTAEGEPHKCHCQGGVTHPCNCYESPA